LKSMLTSDNAALRHVTLSFVAAWAQQRDSSA
jgi:hypothetical protein